MRQYAAGINLSIVLQDSEREAVAELLGELSCGTVCKNFN